MKRYIDSGKTGIIWGLLSSLFFSLVEGTGKYYVYNPYTSIARFYASHFNELSIMLLMISMWSVIGILFEVAGSLFNRIDNLITATIVHFLVTLLGLGSLGYLLSWFELKFETTILFVILFIIIYVIVYLINYKIMKKNIINLNQKLKDING